MAATGWVTLRVELEGGAGLRLDPRPGRVFLVGPRHTFHHLAEAIDAAFARWDLGHLHDFELPDGTHVGPTESDGEDSWDRYVNGRVTRVLDLVGPTDSFTYTFDLGDDWRHLCRVDRVGIDIEHDYGFHEDPRHPVPVWGWGMIPDQHLRTAADE